MTTANKITCYLIGGNSLVIQCCELLTSQGHQVFGIISPNSSVLQWAKAKDIAQINLKDDYLDFLQQQDFDYLFSIANLSMLPIEALQRPNKLAINFHDSLLPRYAGINASSWAIVNGEKSHGVSWHIMEVEADKGDLLKTRAVAIDARETSYSLNLKCYEAAIESFAELLQELSVGQEQRQMQNLAERSYFSRAMRPSVDSILSWKRSAEQLDAYVRAFDFGPQPNDFGIAKLAVGQHFVIVLSMHILSAHSTQTPGTVVKISEQALVIATASRDISITQLMSLEGGTMLLKDFISQYQIYEGYQFLELDEQQALNIRTHYQSSWRHERFWLDKLTQLMPLEIPYKSSEQFAQQPATASAASLDLSHPQQLNQIFHNYQCDEILLAVFIAFLARITGETEFDLGFESKLTANFGHLFSRRLPLRVNGFDQSPNLHEFLPEMCEAIRLLGQHTSYLNEINARYPQLISEAKSTKQLKALIIVKYSENSNAAYSLGTEEEFVIVLPNANHPMQWFFDTRILSKENAEILARQFAAFLQALIEHPFDPIDTLPILSAKEQQQLIYAWNQTQTEYPKDRSIHQLFGEQVQRSPNAIAVLDDKRHMSYQELDAHSTQLALYLRKVGVPIEGFVGIFMERSIDLLVVLLGVLKSGAAYIPLDPVYPKDRIAFMIEDSGLSVVLTQTSLAAALPKMPINILQTDTLWEEINHQAEPALISLNGHSPDNLAYVIYTSGSTGIPKGMQITHRNLTNFLCSMSTNPGFGRTDKLLALTTICFDIAGLELYLPIINGGQVEIIASDIAKDAFLLKERIEHSKASVIQATPATWQSLITAGWMGDSSCKILCGGEALSQKLAEQLLTRSLELWNLFGPTETTIWSSLCKIDQGHKVTIGHPIANTQMYILDKKMNLVPIGIPGELYIGGDGVGRAYLNRPELTRDRFIDNPINPESSKQIYKTGDLVRYLPDGNIEYLGRMDNQAKIRGFRIELGEIESLLIKHPDIHEACVMVRENEAGNKNIIAYIIPNNKTAIATTNELRDYLQMNLPDYMLPTSFVVLDSFPLTPNGKINKNVLPLASAITTKLSTTYVAANSNTEKLIIDIWKKNLGVEKIGIHDNFFEVGGNSLLLIQVLSQLKQQFQRNFSSVDMFKYPSVFLFSQSLSQEEPETIKDSVRVEERIHSRQLRDKRLQLKQQHRKPN